MFFDTGRIAVVEHGHVVGEAVYHLDLLCGQRRTRRGYHILHTALVHGDNVGITFHQEAAVLLHDGLLGEVDAIEFVALVIDFAFGRVDVLHFDALGGSGQHTSAEGYHFTRQRMDGEDDASPEAVAQAVVVRFVAEAGLHQKLFLISFLEGFLGKGIVAVGTVAQLELLDDVVAEAAAVEVGHTDAASVHVVVEDVLEIVACKQVDDKKTFAFALRLFFFVGQFAFLDFDAVLPGQVTQCLGIGQLFVLHDEVNGVSTLAAGKAFAKPFRGRYVERRCLIVVERTQADIVHSAFAQGDEVGHDIGDLCRVHNPVDGCLVYHDGKSAVSFKRGAKIAFFRFTSSMRRAVLASCRKVPAWRGTAGWHLRRAVPDRRAGQY